MLSRAPSVLGLQLWRRVGHSNSTRSTSRRTNAGYVVPPDVAISPFVALAASSVTAACIFLLNGQLRRAKKCAERSTKLALEKQLELEADVAARQQLEDALRQSEERFRGMFHNAPIPIAVGDLKGHCTLANQAACDFIGVTTEEVTGRSIEDIVHPEDLHLTAELFPKLVTGQIPSYSVVRRYVHKSGKIVWGQSTVSLVRDRENKPRYVIGVMSDITERKRAEEALRESEQRFRTVVEAIPQMIWTCRPDGCCDYYNTQWAEYTGISVADSLGHCWSQILHPEELERVAAQWKQSLASGAEFDAETRLRRRGGTYRWFKTRALPLRDQNGQILRWFGSCTDISDIVKAREALARSREDLERLVRKRTASLREAIADLEQFSYSITHDMRGPLRAMQSFALLLERESADRLAPRSLDFLHRITTASERLDRLIQDSLNYSKIAREKLPMHPVDLAPLLRGIVESYPNLQPPNVDLEIAFTRLIVHGNESALTQCFSNLLGNAVKFVPRDRTPRVRVWAESGSSADRVETMSGLASLPGAGSGLRIMVSAFPWRPRTRFSICFIDSTAKINTRALELV